MTWAIEELLRFAGRAMKDGNRSAALNLMQTALVRLDECELEANSNVRRSRKFVEGSRGEGNAEETPTPDVE